MSLMVAGWSDVVTHDQNCSRDLSAWLEAACKHGEILLVAGDTESEVDRYIGMIILTLLGVLRPFGGSVECCQDDVQKSAWF